MFDIKFKLHSVYLSLIVNNNLCYCLEIQIIELRLCVSVASTLNTNVMLSFVIDIRQNNIIVAYWLYNCFGLFTFCELKYNGTF